MLKPSRGSALILSASLALPLAAQQPHKVTQAEVDRITREAILIDTHNDVTSHTVEGYDIATPNKRGQTDLATIMRIADQALYIAKRQGRDRVIRADEATLAMV